MTSAASGSAPRAYLIAGAGGMLGTALQRVLGAQDASVLAPSEADFDITDPQAVSSVVDGFAADLAPGVTGVLVNAAAYTDVERAEDERERAYLVNTQGAAVLAGAATDAGLRFVHVSTDFVFDGRKSGPYTEDDEPHPLSVYGASKFAGEIAVTELSPDALVVRTAWVFGAGGANFPSKILSAARTNRTLRVVTDEVGSPTYTVDLATALVELERTGSSGIFHLAGAGSCSRFELAEEIVRASAFAAHVEPVGSDAFPTKAMRPANSVLDCSKAAALGVTMPPWRDALARFLVEIEAQGA